MDVEFSHALTGGIRIDDDFSLVVPDSAALRRITAEQLLSLGKRQIGYLQIDLHDDEELSFILVGADGVPIVTVETIEQAAKAAMYLSLELVAIH